MPSPVWRLGPAGRNEMEIDVGDGFYDGGGGVSEVFLSLSKLRPASSSNPFTYRVGEGLGGRVHGLMILLPLPHPSRLPAIWALRIQDR